MNPFNHLSRAVEAGYRAFWWKKEDVYHFLQSMSGHLDGRVWPAADKVLVEQFVDLMEYCTGACGGGGGEVNHMEHCTY